MALAKNDTPATQQDHGSVAGAVGRWSRENDNNSTLRQVVDSSFFSRARQAFDEKSELKQRSGAGLVLCKSNATCQRTVAVAKTIRSLMCCQALLIEGTVEDVERCCSGR